MQFDPREHLFDDTGQLCAEQIVQALSSRSEAGNIACIRNDEPDPTENERTITFLDIRQFQAPAVEILLHYTSMPAGFPSPASDYTEDPIDLNNLLIKTPAATFFVKVEGDSMKDANIPSGGLLVVDRSLSARSGDIIVAVINNEFTIKRLQKSPAGVVLLPANPKYHPIQVTADMGFQVWGVVTSVIINAKEL